MKKIILHLCSSEYGSDTRDYSAHPEEYEVIHVGKEIGVENFHPPKGVYGIIANPPCTMFSIARSRAKTPRDLREGMRLVKECLRIIWECSYDLPDPNQRHTELKFWVIENPQTGMLKEFLGTPPFTYSPEEFGDDFTKKTALWGKFNAPIKYPLLAKKLEKGQSVKERFTPMSHNRDWAKITDDRSIASPFFTKAFFEANR
jgi:site-specific DNA-cytosine methylase